jgi:C-terminal processing protease CtpA/Prc
MMNGRVYILTSKATFSSATWFAVIFKYNKIGKLVGEPTGNAPNHYGNPIEGNLTNSKIIVSISKDDYVSPYGAKAKKILKPDIYVPLRAKDVISGNDPVIDWVVNNG